jgi:hypothetical protein
MRALAQNVQDPDTKARMLRVAENYDYVAERATRARVETQLWDF